MDNRKVKRKLAAFFSADVKDYSRLMADNEIETVTAIKACRELISQKNFDHHGRVVDSPGDNLLAQFPSVNDAVACAVAAQTALLAYNKDLAYHRKMEFRIGVNLGDVIEDDGQIYGDGINIAARLEGIAQGGGICISGSAYDQVKNRRTLGYEFLGDDRSGRCRNAHLQMHQRSPKRQTQKTHGERAYVDPSHCGRRRSLYKGDPYFYPGGAPEQDQTEFYESSPP